MGGIMNRPYQVHGQGSKGFTRVQSLLDALVWLQDLAPFLTVGICEIAPAALRKKDRARRPANNHQRRVAHWIDTRSALCTVRIVCSGIRANILTPVPLTAGQPHRAGCPCIHSASRPISECRVRIVGAR